MGVLSLMQVSISTKTRRGYHQFDTSSRKAVKRSRRHIAYLLAYTVTSSLVSIIRQRISSCRFVEEAVTDMAGGTVPPS